MKIHKTFIEDCVWIEPHKFDDNRGIFCETFKSSFLPPFKSVQSSYSFSKEGVLRGMHRTPYAKLVTCVKGNVYDVCVDLRPESPTYKQYFGIFLHEWILNSLYIPPYCAHGFVALAESILVYQQDSEYDKSVDEAYSYKDYGINWPIIPTIISDKDRNSCYDR